VASITLLNEELGFQPYDLLPDAIIVVDQRGVIRYANHQAGQMFGQEPRTLVSGQVEALLPEHLRERHIAHRAKYNSDPRRRLMGTGLDLVAKRADGTTFPVDIMLNPLKHLAEPMVLAVVRDITGRRAAEEAQARLAAIVTSSEDAIVGVTLDGIVTSWNEAAERLFGWSATEMIGQPIRRLIPTDRQAEEVMFLSHVARGERVKHYETVRISKHGRVIDVSVTVSPMRDAADRIIGASGIIRDITARKQAVEALHRSEERLRSSLLHSPLPLVLFDDREQILAISESWLGKSGYSREELRQIEDWTTRAFGERSGPVLEEIRRIMPTEPEAHSSERMIRTKDGHERLWSFVTSPLGTQSDGRHVFVSIAQDVSDRRAYEERIHLLMREARHRTKNILGLVQVIARHTATGDAQDFIDRFTERIRALAVNQDLLVRHEWQRIDVRDLAQVQLGHFADLIGTRINFNGPKLDMNAAAAQAIGLALHELATNAGKYGALSMDAGHVDIGWGTEGDTFTMNWVERDGPAVSAPKRRGFGTTVIEAMTERSVDGKVELDYAPSGLTWRLTCQAVNAMERGGSKAA
jgi:PAS domain S-box-containing protein